eukprot:5683781-Pyramimonas_sp.AAC.1
MGEAGARQIVCNAIGLRAPENAAPLDVRDVQAVSGRPSPRNRFEVRPSHRGWSPAQDVPHQIPPLPEPDGATATGQDKRRRQGSADTLPASAVDDSVRTQRAGHRAPAVGQHGGAMR